MSRPARPVGQSDQDACVFTEAFPILSTRDLPRLLEFYQRRLRFTETYRFRLLLLSRL